MATLPERTRDPSHTGVREVPSSAPGPLSRYRPGDVIGDKYQLVRLLREGGMGTVWVAHNHVLDVHVGIKLIELKKSHTADTVTQRLLDEARAAARLGHASIVRVHDFGETRYGDPFLAMELLEGEDLADLLKREGRVNSIQAVQLLLPIAHALATAHAQNIVHRDVKPENIFLVHDEVAIIPKLLDFGIARMVNSPRKLTVEGSALGTPDYMSPEQARGEPPTEQADLWSFCVVLYEALTGSCPFDGDNYNALMRAIIEKTPPTIAERGVDEPQLQAILERGLKKKKAERWPTMRELGEQLAVWLEERDVFEDIVGTSIYRTWLRDPEVNSRADISALAPLPRSDTGSHVVPSSGPRSASGENLVRSRRARRTGARSGALSAPVINEAPSSSASTPDVALPPGSSPTASEPDLEAIAAINRGGDPVELLEREQRRRVWMVVVGITLVVLLGTFVLLVGTGIILL